MAKPTEKSPGMETSIDLIAHKMFGHTRTGSIQSNTCMVCGKDATQFKDTLSEKEYRISGMCQECQDKTFGQKGDLHP